MWDQDHSELATCHVPHDGCDLLPVCIQSITCGTIIPPLSELRPENQPVTRSK